jgi:ubiquinone/menaquinone biosynthesis C-methylase UbiE
VTQTGPQQADVLSHYRQIASEHHARANRTYRRLVDPFMRDRPRLLELGSGPGDLFDLFASPTAVACDLSRKMLLMRRLRGGRTYSAVAAGKKRPLGSARFDGVFSINVRGHIIDLKRVLAESVRVPAGGSLRLAVTSYGTP